MIYTVNIHMKKIKKQLFLKVHEVITYPVFHQGKEMRPASKNVKRSIKMYKII